MLPDELIEYRLFRLVTKIASGWAVKTDEQGWFHLLRLKPGDYCVMPNAKMICEGYQPTKSLTQKVHVNAGEEVEAEWFGLDHLVDIND